MRFQACDADIIDINKRIKKNVLNGLDLFGNHVTKKAPTRGAFFMVGNEGLEPPTFSTSRRHSPS